MSTFDMIIRGLENGSEYSPSKMPVVSGNVGFRKLRWDVYDIDLSNLNWENMAFELLDDANREGAEPLLENVEDEDDLDQETWIDRRIIIGNLQLNEADCWAIEVECGFEPYTQNVVSADFTLYEGRSQVMTHLEKLSLDEMKDAALNIALEMARATQGNTAKMIMLRDLIEKSGGDRVIQMWDMVATQKALESETPHATANAPRRRI